MLKKGQITLFVIIGLIILILISLFIILTKPGDENTVNNNYGSAEYFVYSCIEPSLDIIYKKIETTLGVVSFFNDVPIIVIENETQIPDQNGFNKIIENEIPAYYESCLNNSEYLKTNGYNLKGKIISSVVTSPEPKSGKRFAESISISLIGNITLNDGETMLFYDKISSSPKFSPAVYLEPIYAYSLRQAEAKGYFDLDALADLGEEYSFKVELLGEGHYKIELKNKKLGWGETFAVK